MFLAWLRQWRPDTGPRACRRRPSGSPAAPGPAASLLPDLIVKEAEAAMDDLLQEFLAETSESLGLLDGELIRLEETPNNKEILSSIFRVFHTIKGTCGFLSLPRLEKVAHAGEDLLSLFRENASLVTPEAISLILRCVDAIRDLLGAIEASGAEPRNGSRRADCDAEGRGRRRRGPGPRRGRRRRIGSGCACGQAGGELRTPVLRLRRAGGGRRGRRVRRLGRSRGRGGGKRGSRARRSCTAQRRSRQHQRYQRLRRYRPPIRRQKALPATTPAPPPRPSASTSRCWSR